MQKAAWRILTGVGAVVAFVLAWTGFTGPELLNEIADGLNLSFLGTDGFRTVLMALGMAVGIALLVGLAMNLSRAWLQQSAPVEYEHIGTVGPGVVSATDPSEDKDSAPPVPEPERDRRSFMPVSPEDIAEICRGKTTVQATNALKDHFGQWMKVEGNVYNFAPLILGVYALNLNRPGSRVIVCAVFRDMQAWKPRLSILNKGERVRVEGKLVEADENGITLDDCEISDQPPNPP